jgi:peptidoglycan/LPS O-acetylase OafA/YrhL
MRHDRVSRRQYALALVVVAIVSALAWVVGRDDPVPAWIEDALIPALGVLLIVAVVARIVIALRRPSNSRRPPTDTG